jgi:hypothetical protein
MPKADEPTPPKIKSLQDLLLLGSIRNPQDPMKGLVGARATFTMRKRDADT